MEQKIRRHFPFFIILIVYLITFSRDLYGGDSPELISAAFFLSSAHPPGYPTFLLLFRTFLFLPFNKAFLANFLNMLLGFSSLILFYKIVMKEIKSEKIAILGIFLLGFSRNFWYQSIYAETYILNLFLILLTYYL